MSEQQAEQPDEAKPPAPELMGYQVNRDADGSVTGVHVSVRSWMGGEERIDDVGFTFRDGDVRLNSLDVSGTFRVSRDMVPVMVAIRAIRDLDELDVGAYPTPLQDQLEQAAQEAERELEPGDGDG